MRSTCALHVCVCVVIRVRVRARGWPCECRRALIARGGYARPKIDRSPMARHRKVTKSQMARPRGATGRASLAADEPSVGDERGAASLKEGVSHDGSVWCATAELRQCAVAEQLCAWAMSEQGCVWTAAWSARSGCRSERPAGGCVCSSTRGARRSAASSVLGEHERRLGTRAGWKRKLGTVVRVGWTEEAGHCECRPGLGASAATHDADSQAARRGRAATQQGSGGGGCQRHSRLRACGFECGLRTHDAD
jgi:hypothetical protein